MSISIKADTSQFDGWMRAFSATKAIVRASDLSAPLVTAALRREAPFRPSDNPAHRHLRDSFRTERHTSAGAVVRTWSSDVPQATWVLDGTRPHPIDPNPLTNEDGSLRYLSWVDEVSGDRVFALHVEHPGTSPNPFNERAWALVSLEVHALFRAELGKEIALP